MANTKKENEEVKKTTSTKKRTTKTSSSGKKTTSTKKAPVKKGSNPSTKKTTPKKVESQKKVPVKKVTRGKKDELSKKQIIEITEVLDEPKKITKEEELAKTVVLEDILEIERGKAVNSRLVIYLIAFAITILIGGLCYIYDFSKQEKEQAPTYNLDEYLDEFGNVKNTSKENNSKNVSSSYENIKEITVEEYKAKLDNKERMLVLVASHTCGICATYEPVLNEVLEETNLKAYKIDIANFTKEEDIALFNSLFNITGTPVTFIIENGAIKTSQRGGKNKDITREFIKNNY